MSKLLKSCQKNLVVGLENSSGKWCTKDADISCTITTYFSSIFTSSNPSSSHIDSVVSKICAFLVDDMMCSLNQPFIMDEVKVALFDMSPNKSPGLDGFHPIFFPKFYDVLGEDLATIILSVIKGESSISYFNNTHIILIPKVKISQVGDRFSPY
ncbi:hypothetical protein PanWU01x14_002290 [Parasponia andersonii]|uniref:Uncharacterized protein n=1 Tax=Parasponia andersonii TaxID=3476 RepID=A0A2P5E560_PARAD|nr:hypothetical protein PanWU01x14_002290 [Parasponia andersonii]